MAWRACGDLSLNRLGLAPPLEPTRSGQNCLTEASSILAALQKLPGTTGELDQPQGVTIVQTFELSGLGFFAMW